MVQPLWKIVWQFLKKLNIDLPYDSVITLQGLYPRQLKAGTQKRYLCTKVHSSTIHSSQKVEATQCPSTDKWISQMWYIHTTEYYAAIEKNKIWIHATATKMTLENTWLVK